MALGRSYGLHRPAGQRTVAEIVRWLEKYGPPQLVMAAVAGDPDVSHPASALGSLACWRADAGLPAHLSLARPERMAERAVLRLVIEHGDGHRMIMPAHRKVKRTL